MQKITVIILAMCMAPISTAALAAASPADQSAPQTPSVQQLLQKYTQALNATQSFTDTYEEVVDFSYRVPTGQMASKQFARGQNRADGRRVYCQKYIWGDFNPQERNLPEDKPRYNLRMDADKKLYVHAGVINTPGARGSANLQPSMVDTPRLNMETFAGSYGHVGCDKRLDAVLAAAKQISVRPATEKVNEVPCHVIDADTQYGRYVVWLDPAHGYNAAKVTRRATGGYKENYHLMPQGDRASGSVVITRFDQVAGVWVPVEAEHKTAYTSGRLFRRSQSRYKRANIVLNPDHDKLGSFDIPLENPANDPELKDGTRVSIILPNSPTIKATWKDGKVIEESGKVINVSELWPTKKLSLLNTPLPTLTDSSADIDAYAKAEIDFEQFQKLVKVFTY